LTYNQHPARSSNLARYVLAALVFFNTRSNDGRRSDPAAVLLSRDQIVLIVVGIARAAVVGAADEAVVIDDLVAQLKAERRQPSGMLDEGVQPVMYSGRSIRALSACVERRRS